MRVIRTSFLIILISIFLAACDPFKAEQIREQAKADALAAQTQMEALAAEQALRQSEDLHKIRMEEERREQERKDAVEQDIRKGLSIFINVTFLAGTAVAIYFVLLVGRSTTTQLVRLQEGFTTAMITAADMRARMIPLDPVTRQYPLLHFYNGKGVYTLVNPNTGVVQLLDSRHDGIRQMIAGSIAVQHTGLLAQEAGKPWVNERGMGSMQVPPIIDGTAKDPIDVRTIMSELFGKQQVDHGQHEI